MVRIGIADVFIDIVVGDGLSRQRLPECNEICWLHYQLRNHNLSLYSAWMPGSWQVNCVPVWQTTNKVADFFCWDHGLPIYIGSTGPIFLHLLESELALYLGLELALYSSQDLNLPSSCCSISSSWGYRPVLPGLTLPEQSAPNTCVTCYWWSRGPCPVLKAILRRTNSPDRLKISEKLLYWWLWFFLGGAAKEYKKPPVNGSSL